jgi:hypothetical protein
MSAENFIGIDVSKDSLEIAFRPSNELWPTDHIAPWRALRLRFQPWLPRHLQRSRSTLLDHHRDLVEAGSQRISVNAGLKFLKIAGLKFPRSSVRFGRWPHNHDLARATRIAEISTLRLYCPLLDNNAPVPALQG